MIAEILRFRKHNESQFNWDNYKEFILWHITMKLQTIKDRPSQQQYVNLHRILNSNIGKTEDNRIFYDAERK